VLPTDEDCGTANDDNCDGRVNEDCVCVPGTFEACYTGPPGTLGVGVCNSGLWSCNEDGVGRGPCEGEIVPTDEICGNTIDDDCDGVVNQPDACVCAPGEVRACYSGPDVTEGVGICVAGTETCAPEGGTFGPCVGEITPQTEDCATDEDDDCNGQSNEPDAGCSCTPGEERACYSGPAATRGVGLCVAGTQTCVSSGEGYGACIGDVTPVPENCGTPDDDDCDGVVNEQSAGCECSPGDQELCYTGPPFTLGVGTCKSGSRVCGASGHWGTCVGEVVPDDDLCWTPLDENCDGSVNEPSSGCSCTVEDLQTLASEDCVLDAGETAWRTPIVAMPRRLAGDEYGFATMLLRRDASYAAFEPVPAPMTARALIARHAPNGDLYWGKELTGAFPPELSYAHSYEMSVADDGVVAFTAPTVNNDPSAFGSDSWTWSGAFRLLYSVDPDGYPLFAVSVPRFASEPNTALHAIAADDDGAVFYANGPVQSHLLRYESDGELSWNVNLNMSLDDLALAPTGDGGVVVAFTTNATVTLGPLPLPPIAGSSSDLVVVRYTPFGTVLWAARPLPSPQITSAGAHAGVLSIVGPTAHVRLDANDGTILGIETLPGAMVPVAPFGLVGTDAVVYGLNQAPSSNFGLGLLDPYGAQATGTFVALHAAGGTRWARAPLAEEVMVGGGPPNLVFAAFRTTSMFDFNGVPETVMTPTVFLTRLAY